MILLRLFLFAFFSAAPAYSLTACLGHVNRTVLDAAIEARRIQAPRPLRKFQELCQKFARTNDFYENPRKIYDKLYKHLSRKLRIADPAAREIADEYAQLIIYERYRASPVLAGWDSIEVRLLSDWAHGRCISRTLDYIALRTDLSGQAKADIFARIYRANQWYTQFRAESMLPEPNAENGLGYLFRGDQSELYITPDGRVYQNRIPKSIGILDDGEPDLTTAYRRDPKRKLDRIFHDGAAWYDPSIFADLDASEEAPPAPMTAP